MRKGASLEVAQADQDLIWAQLGEAFPGFHGGEGVQLVPAQDFMVGSVRGAVLLLFGAVSLVLLIACSNVANLLLNRTLIRGREIGLRASLGATRGRIILQLMTEVSLLFVLGGAVGVALAWLGTGPLVSMVGDGLPRLGRVGMDGSALGFSMGLSLLTGLVFGLSAAFQGLRADLAESVRISDRSGGGDRRGQRFRGSLVVAEIALSVVLLACGGFLLRSFLELSRMEPGFDPENVLTMRTVPRAGDYSERNQLDELYRGIFERAESFPGVSAVGGINLLPMSGGQNCEFVWKDALPRPQPGEFDPTYRCLEVRVVSPGYFRAMGVRLKSGRGFSDGDRVDAAPVSILNQAAEEMMFQTHGAVGESVTLFETRAGIPSVSPQVVGVVGDVRHFSLARDPGPAIYVPFAQEMDPGRRRAMNLVVRSERDAMLLANAILPRIQAVDENLLIQAVQSMEGVVGVTVSAPRFRTTLLLLFGGVGLLLSAIGVAGVVGSSVSRRIPEIGLRVALGARNGEIYATVMGRGACLTLLGLVLGMVAVLAGSSVLSSAGLLFAVEPRDPLVLLVAPLCLAVVAAAAMWVPARRAIRIDPVRALAKE
jgi:putative ABC transport system permease protein